MSMLWPLVSTCLSRGRDVAVVDDQRRYTYSQILGGSLFVAEAIDAATSRPHVGILLPTGGGFPIAQMACWFARRTAVPLNYLLSREEIQYIIADSDIDTIITVGPMLDLLGGESILPAGVKALKLENVDFTGIPPLRWPPLVQRDDLAVILYTSGTSGKPKGVMLTHGNLRSNVANSITHARMTSTDTFLGVLPQFHSFGMTALTLIPLALGAKVVYSARFIPKKIVGLIAEHRPRIIMAVPSMYAAMLAVKSATKEDFTSVRLAISGGEPLPAAVFEEFEARYDVRILEGYGLTETSPVTNWSLPTHWRRKAVGPAIPETDIIIVDDNNRPLPTNADGEILIDGPNIMKGYYKLPELTAQVFTEVELPTVGGGTTKRRFFRTGDIGKIDDDGFLYITGRKKEMLIIAGENVFPREIEEVLNRHPAVHDSAVIGMMDDLRGEVPIAFVELNEGVAFDEMDLRSWCRAGLAQFKVPREIRHLEKLPRNPTGKIMRRALKAM